MAFDVILSFYFRRGKSNNSYYALVPPFAFHSLSGAFDDFFIITS